MQTEEAPCSILIDVTSGLADGAEILEGAALATLTPGCAVSIVGDEPQLTELLQDLPHDAEHLRVIDAPPEAATEGAGPGLLTALRHAAGVRESIVISAAPRFRVLSEACRELPFLPGVERPALAAVYPTVRQRGVTKDPFALLLDVGANLECSADDLLLYATMGAIYAERIAGQERPRVGLLSNTVIERAIPERIREAHRVLQNVEAKFEYIGLQASSRVTLGEADVLVADGYSGELLIGTIEGLAATAEELLSKSDSKLKWRMGVSMLGGGIAALREFTDWDNYGGSPILGLSRPVIILQPGAKKNAVVNAVRLARKIAREQIWEALAEGVAALEPT